ncbi:MAG: transporter substrate-binding domain-containing protein [Mariniphaga sp.]|nr:transporter substrate-binding domain-containing protein [Mariniphaga sp.]MDD4424371.1 transporter substrate-binding domain-containing protein [Mariniphaga sp.]
MNQKYRWIKKFLVAIFSSAIVLLWGGCKNISTNEKEKREPSNMEAIQDSGVLKVVIDYNSTNYFIYRGQPMGYQYELVLALCSDLGVKPEITVSNDLGETFEGIKSGRFDLIAKNLTVTKDRKEQVSFTKPLKQTRQVIVQRKASPGSSDSPVLNSTLQLAGKKIYVQKSTSYYQRLLHLSEEIGYAIEVVEDSVYGVEQLVAMVSQGEIDFTVCDENVALLNKSYYPNLDVSLKISFPQNIAWAVRKGASQWKEFLDHWIIQFQKTQKYKDIYHRYFESPRTAGRFNSEYHSISGGKISVFDPLVRELSLKYGWDWRLISSIIYHESTFDPEAVSWEGAAGLMQLMPVTAESLGVEDITDPRQNIEGGILFLNWLNEQFASSIPDSTERIKFVLASYNIGLGHVKDAQRLAEKFGKNSQVWDDHVDFYLKNKSSEKYFKDPVVRWGYSRGEEAYNFVNRVIDNYLHYTNLIPEST